MRTARIASNEEIAVRLLTINEASDRLGLKPKIVRFWIWTRRIEHVKLGRAVPLREETIQSLIERGTVPVKQDA